mgnify:CR=1 FL=1
MSTGLPTLFLRFVFLRLRRVFRRLGSDLIHKQISLVVGAEALPDQHAHRRRADARSRRIPAAG